VERMRLTLRFDPLLPHDVHFTCEHLSGRRGGIDTVGLDGNDDGAAVLEEVVRVEGDDAGLVRLGDVGEDDVDHLDEHAVFLRVAGIFDDGYGEGRVSKRRASRGLKKSRDGAGRLARTEGWNGSQEGGQGEMC
jgi:hypothetical protein